jgi:NAD(P)-dependent dehydrogenase (short-subunit alcohol dehydrogenase family)
MPAGDECSMVKPFTAVVTGASAGLGRAISWAFGKEGANLGLIARNLDALEKARTEVEQLGGKALSLPLDVSDADAVEHAAAEVERAFGPIGIWINNAMVSVFSPVKEMRADEYRRVTEVNYLGYVCPEMKEESSRLVLRWRYGAFLCNQRIVHRSTPSLASLILCDASCIMTKAK